MNNPPKLEEVRVYCKERKLNVDPDHFWNHFTKENWRVKGKKMKSWKASIQAIHHKSIPKKEEEMNKTTPLLNKTTHLLNESAQLPPTREDNLPSEVMKPASQHPHFYPANKPLPTSVQIHKRLNPCQKCRRITLDDGGQATVTTSTRQGISFHRCKSCGHRWKMVRKIV